MYKEAIGFVELQFRKFVPKNAVAKRRLNLACVRKATSRADEPTAAVDTQSLFI